MKAQPEKVTELDALGPAAAAADAGIPPEGASGAAPGPGTGPGVASAADQAKEWAQFPALFGSMISQAMPELKAVYTDDACRKWGEAMVPLAERYGWSPGAFMEWLGPWLGVSIATWPLAAPTVKAIRARRAAKAEPAPAGSEKETSNVVAMPGAAVDPDLVDPTKANPPPRPV